MSTKGAKSSATSATAKPFGSKQNTTKPNIPANELLPEMQGQKPVKSPDSKERRPTVKSPSAISTKSKRSLREKVLTEKIRKCSITESENKFGTPFSELLDMDPLLQDSELPRFTIDTDDCTSVGTDISMASNHSRQSMLPTQCRKGAGVAMDEATKLANETLLRGKTALEEAGNMKRECKATAIDCLQTLYETALALSDSRSRHKYNLEKERSRNAQELVRIERAHNKEVTALKQNLHDQITKNQTLIENTLSEARDVKKWLNFETQGPFQGIADLKKDVQKLSVAIDKQNIDLKIDNNSERQAYHEKSEIKNIMTKLDTTSNQVNTLRVQIDKVIGNIEKFTTQLAGTTATSAIPESPATERIDLEQNTKIEEISNQITIMNEILTRIEETQHTSKHRESPTPATVLTFEKGDDKKENKIITTLEQIKKEVAELGDITVATATPIRTAVEELRGEIKNYYLPTHFEMKAALEKAENLKTAETLPQRTMGRTKDATYASVAATPRYSLVIESIDPQHTSDDIVKTIKSSVDVIQMGIGICQLRKTRNQKVVIGCDSEPDRNSLEESLRSKNKKLTISKPNRRNPQIKLRGVIRELTDVQIEEAIIKQNASLLKEIPEEGRKLKVLRRTRASKKEVCGVVIETSPTVWRAIVDKKLRIGYQIVNAVDQSPVTQCYRCLGYGHLARDCDRDTICGNCSENHDSRDCQVPTDQFKCANCASSNKGTNANHAAYSSVCPEWQKWDRIARSAVDYCC